MALSELGKPIAVGILLLTIIGIGIALNWMAKIVTRSIAEVKAPVEQPAEPME